MPATFEIEQLLNSLRGVMSARVVSGADGSLVEVHVLADPDLHPKQVVRNVESALLAGLGIEVDRRVVSVSQLEPGAELAAGAEPEAPAARNGSASAAQPGAAPGAGGVAAAAPRGAEAPERSYSSRVAFAGFRSHSRALETITCEVVLRAEGSEFTGSATGSDTPSGRLEAAARATFAALELACAGFDASLEGVATVQAHGGSFVLVLAQGRTPRGSVPLVGSAPLSHSPEQSAILASLQATNRWAGRRPRASA